jgi:hypothetical protein
MNPDLDHTLCANLKGLKVGRAVFLEWEDSYGCSSRWEDIPEEGRPELMVCRSLGWIVRKSKRVIVLVPHRATNERLGVDPGVGT